MTTGFPRLRSAGVRGAKIVGHDQLVVITEKLPFGEVTAQSKRAVSVSGCEGQLEGNDDRESRVDTGWGRGGGEATLRAG